MLQPWTTLIGNFRESSRKVLKFDIWLFIYLLHVSIVWDEPRSVAFNLYCHNSMPTFAFWPSEIFLVTNSAYFVFPFVWHLLCIDTALVEIFVDGNARIFCIDAALMEISANGTLNNFVLTQPLWKCLLVARATILYQYRHYEKILLMARPAILY